MYHAQAHRSAEGLLYSDACACQTARRQSVLRLFSNGFMSLDRAGTGRLSRVSNDVAGVTGAMA